MSMDTVWLILAGLFTIYSLYAWRKYSDQQSLLLASVSAAAVLLLVTKLFLVNLFPENIKPVLDFLIWISWLPILYFLGLVVYKTQKYGVLYEESKRDVDSLIKDIVPGWDSNKLISLASSELLNYSSVEEVRKGLSQFADRFGSIREYVGSSGKLAIPFNPFQMATVKHVADIVFERGAAKIYIERIKDDGHWKIRSFYIKPINE